MLLVLAMCALAFGASAAGPFGFERGMTKEQIIALVGNYAVKQTNDDALLLTRAPKPHPDFDQYMVTISPERGLLKISAIGITIQTNRYGTVLKAAFDEVRTAVASTYGPPSKDFNFLRSGSIWNEPEDWMMGLVKEERVLASYWDKELPNHIVGIVLEANTLSTEKGYLVLRYEFAGFSEYAGAKKAKAGKVF